MPSRRLPISLAACVVAAITMASSAAAQVGAQLSLAPKRLVVDPSSRTASVLVLNQGSETATYNIEMVDRVMTSDGRIQTAEEAAANPRTTEPAGRLRSAKSMVTFTPRRVTLGPGESQTVRLRILRPADLAPGEYRSHFTVTAVPPQDTGLTAEQAAAQAEGSLAVRLTALFSISIPLIVRQGPAQVAAEVANVSYMAQPTEGAPASPSGLIKLDVVRKGASSLYGDVEVRSARASEPLGALRGFGVYTEIDRRTVQIPLTRKPSSGERLELVFKDEDLKPGQVLATESFTVP